MFDSQTNNGKEEPEEKKQKTIKKGKKKQKETKDKNETIRKKKHMNHVAIKVMEEAQPHSKVKNFLTIFNWNVSYLQAVSDYVLALKWAYQITGCDRPRY